MHSARLVRGLRWLAILVCFTIGLTACDGGEEAEEEPTATPTKAAARDIEEYCQNFLAIETVQPDIDFEAPPEQVKEGARKFAKEKLRPLANEILATTPEELKDEMDVLNAAVTELERTGDFEVFEKEEFEEAEEVVDDYNIENCGWEEVSVTGADYSFSGVPAELKAGPNFFRLANNGAEHHEMVIFRKNDGVTETFDQILALPEDQAQMKMTFQAATDAHPKDEHAHAVGDLKAGQHVVVCFLPVGSTPEAEEAAEKSGNEIEGPPHFTRGMKAEFTVR